MKLTCKDVKHILIGYQNRIYKSGSKVRIDLKYVDETDIERIRIILESNGIKMYRDDFVHLPYDWVLE